MKRSKPSVLRIGSVSSGTLRVEDLLPAFLWEAERLRLSKSERATVRGIRQRYDAIGDRSIAPEEIGAAGVPDVEDYWQNQASEDVDTLQTILGAHVPDYCYFGTLEGDGAEFGCWVDRERLEEGDIMNKQIKTFDVKELWLNCNAINIRSIDMDWSEGYGERWDTIYPSADGLTEDEIRTFCVLHNPDVDLPEADAEDVEERLHAAFEAVLDRVRDEGSDTWEPMMNYYYPLPGYRGDSGADQAWLDLARLPLVLVTVNDETVLALSGGGMDLSWEICRAFVLLGYWPPVEFCRLPAMADKYNRPENRELIAICKESCRILQGWMESTLRELDRVEASLRPEEK